MTTTNTYGRQVVVPLTNKSGGGVVAGDVVIVDTANNDAFTTTTSGASTATIGVAQETIASNAIGRVLLSGYAALVNVNASVTRGHYGATHTVAKQATDAGASRTAGTFCQFLTGGTTPDAVVYPSDLGTGAGTGTLTTVKDEGSNLSTAVVSMDFVGKGVTATGTTAVTVTIPGNLPAAFARRNTGGNYSLNNNSTFAAIDATNLTATVAAATGDILMITFIGRYNNEAVNAFIDVATIVSAAAVNYVSGGTGASTDFGVEGWLGLSGVAQAFGGTVYYTVQAGDISSGNVTVRPYYRTGSAAVKTLNSTSANNGALFFGVVNLRQ